MPPKKIPSVSRNRRTMRARSQPTQPSAAQAAPRIAPDEGKAEQPSQSDAGGIDILGGSGDEIKPPRSAPSLLSPQQLAGMSKEQLRVIVMGLQMHSKPLSGSRSHKRTQSTKRKRVTSGAGSDGSDEGEDDEDADKEDGDEYEDEGADDLYDDESEAPGSEADDTGKNIEKIISTHVHRSICTAGGWKNLQAANETLYDQDRVPIFLLKNNQGVELISPVWERTFDENWRHWGPQFIRQCRDKGGMGPELAILKKVSDERFKENLRAGAWRRMSRYAREKARGIFDKYQVARVAQAREHARQKLVLGRRSRDREGTCVADKKFNWLFNIKCQSRVSSESEDTRRSIIFEPSWRNPMITKVFDALDQKGKLNGRNYQKKIFHLRVDTLPLVLEKNERYPFWALNPHWAETHPADLKRVEYIFDMTDKAMPNVSPLLQQYKCPGRTYITQLPTPRRPRPAVPAAPARPPSPSGTIDLRSASPPIIAQEPSVPIQAPRSRSIPRIHLVVKSPLDQTHRISQPPFLRVTHPDSPTSGPSSMGSSRLLRVERPGEDSRGPATSFRASVRKMKKARTKAPTDLDSGIPKVKEEQEQETGNGKKDKGKGKQVAHELDDGDGLMTGMSIGTRGGGHGDMRRSVRKVPLKSVGRSY